MQHAFCNCLQKKYQRDKEQNSVEKTSLYKGPKSQWMYYLDWFSAKHCEMFCSHHHKAHKFVTENLFNIIRLKKKKKSSIQSNFIL